MIAVLIIQNLQHDTMHGVLARHTSCTYTFINTGTVIF